MTRSEASYVIYEIINSGIISEKLEEELEDVANAICEDSFEKCSGQECERYCDGCEFFDE